MVPQIGRIPVVSNGVETEKHEVLGQWKRVARLLRVEPKHRGWTADVLRCVERLYSAFTLDNVYAFEEELSRAHPNNHNVRAKIRQQLQVLRDLGLVEFVSPGTYRYLKSPLK